MSPITDLELGWLVGLIDGAGSFGIRLLRKQSKHLGERIRVQPQLIITNTDKTFLASASDILSRLGIHYRLYDRLPKNGRRQYNLIIHSNGLRLFLPLIKKITRKTIQLEVLLELLQFIEDRKTKKILDKFAYVPYTVSDLKYIDSLRQRLILFMVDKLKIL